MALPPTAQPANDRVSSLMRDLGAVPAIIADLGLGIAEAQKAMNLAYLEGLERVVVQMRVLGLVPTPTDGAANIVIEVLRALGPRVISSPKPRCR